MPFGLTSAPATFQAAMNSIFKHIIRKHVLVFVDDILIISNTLEDHLLHLQQVFYLQQQNHLYVKLSKCSFAQQQHEYLGHIIGKDGVATDSRKIEDVKNWPVPTSVNQVRAFLGLAGYYRRFLQNSEVISRPLNDLLKKGTVFVWTDLVQKSF